MRVAILRAHELGTQPWANGGGTTVEYARGGGSVRSVVPWTWRVSIAELLEPGAFSSLPGVTRYITFLGPGTIELSINGNAHTMAAADSLSFSGEDPAQLLALHDTGDQPAGESRAARALNVMTHEPYARASVTLIDQPGQQSVHVPECDVSLGIMLRGFVQFGELTLEAGDAVEVTTSPQTAAPHAVAGSSAVVDDPMVTLSNGAMLALVGLSEG